MVSLAWVGGRWIPFDRMVKGVVEFGLGALVLVVVLLLVPRLLDRAEQRLEREPATLEDGAAPR
jgi:hypothetical protein